MIKFKALQSKKQYIHDKYVIGIDPGKRQHFAAILDPKGLQVCHGFTIDVSHQGFQHFLKLIHKLLPDIAKENIIFSIESSCNLWQVITDYLEREGYSVVLCSPLTTYHSRALPNHDYSKTDPKDALLVAQNTQQGCFDYYVRHPDRVRAMHQLSIAFHKLLKDRQRHLGRIRAMIEHRFPEFFQVMKLDSKTALHILKTVFMPKRFQELSGEAYDTLVKDVAKLSRHQHGRQTIDALRQKAQDSIGIPADRVEEAALCLILSGWIAEYEGTCAQLEKVKKELIQLAKEDDAFAIITSLTGVGDELASRFLAECYDVHQYRHHKAIEKMSGMNLRQSQSGQYIGQRRISGIGNSRLRVVIYLMIEQTSRTIPEVRIKFLKRQLASSRYRKNIIACSSVLLRLVVRLIKDKRPYEYRTDRNEELAQLEKDYAEKKAKTKKKKNAA